MTDSDRPTSHAIRCRCGTLRGHVVLPATTSRALCYCKDCQAFARWLGREGDVLDAQAGTDIVATMPSHVRFDGGLEALACMSLSAKGLFRWYASCCRTPIGNTPRDPRIHYVGLIRSALAAPLEPSFGPATLRLNTGSARGKVAATPVALFFAMLKLLTAMVPARLRGRWHDNPFFDPSSGRPVRAPQVLGTADRANVG